MLTQDDYKLFTNSNVSFSDEGWTRLVNVASGRLASFLCLSEFPELVEGENDDLAELLANFLCKALALRGDNEDVESKSVRNFTIRIRKGAANAYAQIYDKYFDVIEKWSECGSGIVVEKSRRRCCECYGF